MKISYEVIYIIEHSATMNSDLTPRNRKTKRIVDDPVFKLREAYSTRTSRQAQRVSTKGVANERFNCIATLSLDSQTEINIFY